MTPEARHLPVSVIIPTFNRAHLVGRAIRSALAQCCHGDEVIVVDDGSTDGTDQAIAPYRDRIVYIRSPHVGAGAARNRGVSVARNPLVAFLDSDDEWLPDKLRRQRLLMQLRPDVLFCFTEFSVQVDGRRIRNYLHHWHHDPRSWDEILGPGTRLDPSSPADSFLLYVGDLYGAIMSANYVFTSTLMVRREEAGEALRFEENLPCYEDWFCYGRLARRGLAAFLDVETACQLGHRGPRLTDLDVLGKAECRLRMLERIWGSDQQFRAEHGNLYENAVAAARIAKVRRLVVLGRTEEARRELRLVPAAPWRDWLLASLPGSLAALPRRLVLRVRELLRQTKRRVERLARRRRFNSSGLPEAPSPPRPRV